MLVAVGLFVLSRLGLDSSYWLLLVGLVPLGIGMDKAKDSSAGASHAGGQAAAQADVAFASGMQSALLVASIAVLVAAVAVVALLPRSAD